MAFNKRRNRVDVDAIGEFISALVDDINTTYNASKNKYEKYAKQERKAGRGRCRTTPNTNSQFGANIAETDEAFFIEAVLPGFQRSDISIQIDGELLKIKAEKAATTSEDNKKFKLKEFALKPLKRAFKLSDRIDRSAIKAKSEDGILTVKLPKKTADVDEPQTIEVS